MTYNLPPHNDWDNATQPNQPTGKPKSKGHPIGLYIGGAFLLIVLILCGVGTTVAVTSGDDKAKTPALTVPDSGTRPTPNVPTKTPTPAPDPTSTLTKKDVELTVKITDKSCFGSAGCNVEWEIKAAVEGGHATTKVAPGDSCAVTYRMKGLEDTKVGTLVVNDDGTYNTDSWTNFGQTKRASSKVTAEVTDVECR